MARYHINPETGNPGVCRATKQCRFGDHSAHYDSQEAAQAAYEASMATAVPQSAKKEGPEELTERYDFPAYKLEDAVKRIERANRRAEKAGIEERFGYTVDTYEVREEKDGMAVVQERVRLTLDRPTLQHQGWSFAGTMSWDPEAGLITRMVPGEELLEKPEAELCDVCKTTRHRTDTYIVQKGDEQKQVGSNCLQRFMGIKPAGLWMMDFDIEDDVRDDERGAGQPWESQRRDTKELLALGLALVERNGWTSRSVAYESGGTRLATADQVESFLTQNTTSEEDRKERLALMARATELQQEADEVLAAARTIDGDSDYAQNLRALAQADSVSMRNMPLLLSAIAHRKREQAKAIEQEAKAQSEWVGTVGEKIPQREVTVEDVKTVNGFRGTSLLVTMRDDEGNLYKTFYSGAKEPQAGTRMAIAGTVKDHQEWQGAKETMLGRVKFETVRPSEAPASTLPSSSPYVGAWTVEEVEELNSAEHRRINKEMRARAGTGGWDNTWSRPKDPALAEERSRLLAASDEEYTQRYRELTDGV